MADEVYLAKNRLCSKQGHSRVFFAYFADGLATSEHMPGIRGPSGTWEWVYGIWVRFELRFLFRFLLIIIIILLS